LHINFIYKTTGVSSYNNGCYKQNSIVKQYNSQLKCKRTCFLGILEWKFYVLFFSRILYTQKIHIRLVWRKNYSTILQYYNIMLFHSVWQLIWSAKVLYMDRSCRIVCTTIMSWFYSSNAIYSKPNYLDLFYYFIKNSLNNDELSK